MEFFEVIKNLGALVGLFLSVMSAIGVITKMQNKHFKQLFDEHSAETKKNDEGYEYASFDCGRRSRRAGLVTGSRMERYFLGHD